MNNCKYCGAPGFASRQENCYMKPKPCKIEIPQSVLDEIVERCAIELGMAAAKAFSGESESEKMQGELEPLPGGKWDGEDIGEVLKHGRE